MNKELLKMKKILSDIVTPSREEELSKALRTIFHDIDEGITEQEAFQILGWDYKSKSELFGDDTKEQIKDNTILSINKGYEPIVFTKYDVNVVEGANVKQITTASKKNKDIKPIIFIDDLSE